MENRIESLGILPGFIATKLQGSAVVARRSFPCRFQVVGGDAITSDKEIDRAYRDAKQWLGEDFTLVNDPPAHRAAQFDNLERTAPRPLIDGLACLPDQLDLF